MASKNIKGITIEIGGDTTGLDKALKNVEKGSNKAKSELKEVDRALKNAPDSAVLWAQKQELLTKAIEESKKKLDLLENAQEQVEKQFQNKEIGEEQYRAFQREVENAQAQLNHFREELDDTRRKAEEAGDSAGNAGDDIDKLGDDAENAGEDVEDLGESAETAGNKAEESGDGFTVLKGVLSDLVADGIRVAGSAMKEFSEDVVKTGITFESSMSSVAAISGATSDELEMLSIKAQEMGATTKFTASEAADAFGYMALAGWKTDDMLNGIDGILNLAAASNIDLANASDIVTDYLTAFGLAAQDSAKFADIMSYAMANSNTTTELLGEAYKNCAATAASMGYSVEETTAVIMTMANAGVKGGEAGTALNSIMTRLATNTKDCATALGGYGVNIYNSEGSMNTLSSILEGISDVWSTLNDEQQAGLAKAIAGTNQYSALQTIMNGLSESAEESGMSFAAYSNALNECDGAAQNMATTMIDNLEGDMTILGSAVDGMKLSLSNELTPVLRDTVQYITEQVPNIQNSLEKVFKKGADGVNWLVKHLPEIKDTAKKILPLVEGIGAGFVAWKAVNGISKGITTVKNLSTALNSGKTVMQALNLTMSANPAVAVATGVVALTTALIAFSDSQKDANDELKEAIDKENDYQKSIQDNVDNLAELKKSTDDAVAAEDAQWDKVNKLWQELDNLADSNGKVSEKEEAHAQYILGELNDALGTEYTMVGNQIQNYQDLKSTIDDVIASKRAEALLETASAAEVEALQQQSDAKKAWKEKQAEIESYTATVSAFEDKINRYGIGVDFSEYGSGDYDKLAADLLNYTTVDGQHLPVSYDEAQEYIRARTMVDELSESAALLEEQYTDATSMLDKLSEAETAYSEGRYQDAIDLVLGEQNANKKILEDDNTTKNERLKAFNELQDDITKDLQLAVKARSQIQINDALSEMKNLSDIAAQGGFECGGNFSGEFKAVIAEMLDAGYDISRLAAWGKDSGVDVGEAFSGKYVDTVQDQLDKGYDITDLVKWGSASGLSVGDIFGDNYYDVVQKQIDAGYDTTWLLQWGADSGLATSDEYVRLFKENVQNGFNDGFNTDALIAWAEQSGKTLGDVFGSNFKSYYTQYLYDTNDLIPKTIRSASDAKLAASGAYNVQAYATGGFISNGSKGIVAEAGPELIEIMNGGVRVTPLTDTARNTAVGTANGQNVFYNTYNVTVEKISSDYDVKVLSQRLAAEQRKIESGKGK